MGLGNLSRRNDAGANIPNRDELIARYKHLRAVGRKLNHKMVERLSKDVLHEGAGKIGVLHKGILVFDSEDESAVLMDYCLYDVRRNGRNAVEQYLVDSPPDPESDEMVCLRAMQRAVYSLFVVESVIPGFGITVRDLLSNDTILIADIGLGSSAQPGLVFASRLLFHEGFAMTGGAGLPVGLPPEDRHQKITEMLVKATAPDENGHFDPAPLIRACLRRGSSSHVQYEEPTGRPGGRQPVVERLGPAKVGRNAPCPCGSGKKFKNCCLRKPQIGGP